MMTEKEVIEYLRSPSVKRVVLDTDTANEADDQFALAYAALCPNIELVSVCAAPFTHTDGSDAGVGCAESFEEAKKVIELTGVRVPCHMGAESFMKDTAMPVMSPAVSAITDAAHMLASPAEPLVVCGIGAGTNIASALLLSPDIADRIIVLWQAGNSPENGSGGEYNMCGDIAAAKVIFDSGVPLVQCPAYDTASVLSVSLGELEQNIGETGGRLCGYLLERLYSYVGTRSPSVTKVIWDIGVIGILDRFFCVLEVRDRPKVTDAGTYTDGKGSMVLCSSLDRAAVYGGLYRAVAGK